MAEQATFGAHFVEGGVDAATGETRVRRMLAVYASGRILNPKTARSQVIGATTMGVGAALMEELVVEPIAAVTLNPEKEAVVSAALAADKIAASAAQEQAATTLTRTAYSQAPPAHSLDLNNAY